MEAYKNPTTLTVVGGFTKTTLPLENKIVVGINTTNYFYRKKIDWESFIKIYKKEIYEKEKYNDFLNAINKALPMPLHTNDEKQLVYMIETLYNSDCDKIFYSILKNLKFIDLIKQTMQHLFMIWKTYIETLIELYVNLRNDYIIKNNLDDEQNDFSKMLEKWIAIDLTQKIDTSSLILFFNFPPDNVIIEDSVPKIKWGINDDKIKKLIKLFNDAITNNKFQYKGYCNKVIIERWDYILKFPINQLINLIDFLEDPKDKKIININNMLSKKIQKCVDDINIIKNKKINIKKFKKEDLPIFTKSKMPIDYFISIVKLYFTIYDNLIPTLIEKENDIVNISLNINKIAQSISSIVL